MYNTILIPIDMSQVEKAKEMITIAKTQAVNTTRFILLYVLENPPGRDSANMLTEKVTKEEERKAVKKELGLIADTESLPNADIQVLNGRSYSTILDVAKDENAQLIIIGSHKPNMSDYFLGSTAARVVRHAKCSVYVVR
jgi:nucleotide-binding universal stress UspA family protein